MSYGGTIQVRASPASSTLVYHLRSNHYLHVLQRMAYVSWDTTELNQTQTATVAFAVSVGSFTDRLGHEEFYYCTAWL